LMEFGNWRTFKQGAFSNADQYGTYVMETEGVWQKYWANVVGGKAADAPKTINWASEKLVAINLGRRPNSGYELYVRSVERGRANEIVVYVVERTPIPGMMYAQVVINPWIVIKMDRAAGNIVFKKETVDGSNLGGGSRIVQLGQDGDCCNGPCRCCSGCNCRGDHRDDRNDRGGRNRGGSTGG
jgi:hypothetical protein